MAEFGYQTIGAPSHHDQKMAGGVGQEYPMRSVPHDVVGHGDNDERIFLIDSQEYSTQDPFCRDTMATFTNILNTWYRMTHRVGMLVLGFLLIMVLPIWGFTLGMVESAMIILVRPVARIVGKVTSDFAGTNQSSRYFRYRDYKDYRAQIFDSTLSV